MPAGKKKAKKSHAKTILAPRKASPPPAPPPLAKYALGKELGRGGLGRVVEAVDRDIGRAVALKLLLEGAPLDLVERFRREGRITGRLEHPNIVPVHEVGTLPGSGGEVFFAMKKIAGRDLADALREFRQGTGAWTLRRLVEIFRDVCRAMAFAHSKGVIHRDLKPSNVMVGEFGEVLVVDWGLAKDRRESQVEGRGAAAPADPMLTLDGDVFGTPDYMSPEQAEGRVADVDERSDVFSLGAILYEILAGRPPFTGGSTTEILRRVVSEAPTRPSDLLLTRPVPPAGAPAAAPVPIASVPPELEAVCLKALSKAPASRHASALALGRDIQAWLDGALERERLEGLANGAVASARAHVAEWHRLAALALETERQALRTLSAVPGHADVAAKEPGWREEDEAARLRSAALREFADADGDLATALSLRPAHAAARQLRAELSWARFLEAEREGSEAEAVMYRRAAERWNDGPLDEALRDEGRLRLRVVAYSCDCLRRGRALPEADRRVGGYDPWDGRPVEGGERDPEAGDPPATARAHGPGCSPAELAGAEAWAWRLEESARRWFPVSPPGRGGRAAPPALLDQLFGASPYRPRGPGLHLGVSPGPTVVLPIGSWLVVAAAPGRVPVRLTVVVRRGVVAEPRATMFRPDEIPEGFAVVSEGPYPRFSDRMVATQALEDGEVTLDDVLVSRHPVTCAEYAAWLNELRRSDEAGAVRREPRYSHSRAYWPRNAAGDWEVPTESVLAARPPDGTFDPRLSETARPWDPRWPVIGIAWRDAMAYARSFSRRTGWLAHLPLEDQLEKSWRGADGRVFPWGDAFDPSFCNMNASRHGQAYPAPVDDFPFDESPYGVRGLAGNACDLCLNLHGARFPQQRVLRGGGWGNPAFSCRATTRTAWEEFAPNMRIGFRLAVTTRLPAEWPPPGPAAFRSASSVRR